MHLTHWLSVTPSPCAVVAPRHHTIHTQLLCCVLQCSEAYCSIELKGEAWPSVVATNQPFFVLSLHPRCLPLSLSHPHPHPHLGLHVGGAGVAAQGRQVAQGLALLLQAHDGVLLEHGGGGGDLAPLHRWLLSHGLGEVRLVCARGGQVGEVGTGSRL